MLEIGMSLDEIIQKKKTTTGTRNGKGRFPPKPNRRPTSNMPSASGRFNAGKSGNPVGKPVADARNKIIHRENCRNRFWSYNDYPSKIYYGNSLCVQKNRSKIRDARDKLVQIAKRSGDARLKLIKKQENHRVPLQLSTRKQRRQPMVADRKPAYRQRDDFMEIEDDYILPAPLALRRTVKNEIAMMPPLPTFKVERRPPSNSWNSDPFDCYEVPTERPSDVSEPRHLQRTIRNPELDLMPMKGILRSSRALSPPLSLKSHGGHGGHGSYIPDENSHLSYEMRTRLKTLPPDSNASMGMFSNPYAKTMQPPKNSGYRIVVSNLHSSVSQSDIKELFEDIGTLIEARLVRPGVAEVIYTSMKDAETAVDTYHNRQLDGQPMKCLLVNPRSIQNKPTAPAIKRSSSSSYYGSPNDPTNKSFEVDIDALHSVLFRRH